ncbi:hypothetical protein Tco_1316671 [Tanacetum coccineum]
MPHDLPLLRVHTLRSDEDRMQHNELIDLVTKLSDRVVALETDLKQTKLTYGTAYTKLIMKVKKLENKVESNQARRRAKIGRQEHDMEFEFDLDAAKDVSTAEEDISTAKPVSTAGTAVTTASVDVSTAGAEISTASPEVKIVGDFGDDIAAKTYVHQKDAAKAKKKEWEDIQAKVEADEELTQRLQAEEREMYSEVEQARMLQSKGYSFDEIKELFETTIRRVNTFVPMETKVRREVPELVADSSQATVSESTIAGSSKRDAEEELAQENPEQGMNVEALQTKYPIIDWEIYTEEGNRHLHAHRERVSIVKRNSYTDAGCKDLGGTI